MTMKINGLYLNDREPDAIVAGCVAIYENMWPNPQSYINAVEQECMNPNSGVYWTRAGTIGAGPYQNARTNKLLSVTELAEVANNRVLQDMNNIFYTMILGASNSYARKYEMYENFFHEGYNLLRYDGGEEYKAHYDGGTEIGRSISAICYLNDNYEGGELEFVNFRVKIKPQAGMLVLFPSNYAYKHVAHPVINGSKYAMVTWIKDRQV
jgi:Rps23 Pro-64 3,4-dihydroxylase Tpa1-like proline 4-hydroxylase